MLPGLYRLDHRQQRSPDALRPLSRVVRVQPRRPRRRSKDVFGGDRQWNGEDIVDIIAKKPAAARFLSRHLYDYFVADEAPVPAWMDTPPRDMDTIRMLEEEYFRSNYNIRSMLRILFNSDKFKNARLHRIKGPIETVIGTFRLIGEWTTYKPGMEVIFDEMKHMGQEIFNPPSVRGWHTGREWIDGGTLVHRINFIADNVSDPDKPAYRNWWTGWRQKGRPCRRRAWWTAASACWGTTNSPARPGTCWWPRRRARETCGLTERSSRQRVAQTLQMIVATKEYLYA